MLGSSWESLDVPPGVWGKYMNIAVSCIYISLNKSFQKEEEALLEPQLPTGNRKTA